VRQEENAGGDGARVRDSFAKISHNFILKNRKCLEYRSCNKRRLDIRIVHANLPDF
jgi:hypothetical protein